VVAAAQVVIGRNITISRAFRLTTVPPKDDFDDTPGRKWSLETFNFLYRKKDNPFIFNIVDNYC
jgi:hypothetical protein